MAKTADLLTDSQVSGRLPKIRESLPDAAAVMVVEWRARAKALRRHANVFLGFIVLALVAGIVFVWLADILVERGIKAAGMAQIDVLRQRESAEIELFRKRKTDALKQLEDLGAEMEARRDTIITAMDSMLRGDDKTWTKVDTGTRATLWEMHFADDKTGWVIGQKGTLLQTRDGETWTKVDTGTTATLWEMHFADDKT